MRRGHIFFYGTFTLGFFLVGPLAAQAPPRTVRVAATGQVGTPQSLMVTAGSAWRLIDLSDRRMLREGTGRAEWRFATTSPGKVTARSGEDLIESRGFRLEGVEQESLLTLATARGPRVYPGAVEVLSVRTRSGSGLQLINEAPMERYLAGVVTAEGAASFQPEALKALAVAARSYAERNRFRHAPVGEMCDTVHCQVYPGVGRVPEKVAKAVADTAGVVGLWGGECIDAVYSADCGGRTRNSEDGWSSRNIIPYLRTVEDRPAAGGAEYCSVNRNHTVRVKLAPTQVARLAGLSTPAGPRLELSGVERDGSGRVSLLRLASGSSPAPKDAGPRGHGDVRTPASPRPRVSPSPRPSASQLVDTAGDEPLPCELVEAGAAAAAPEPVTPAVETSTITLTQIRQTLGSQFRGRLVDASLLPDGGLELECRGLGHGVGLCQWGAQGMALSPHNRTCEEILRHYYTGITLGPTPLRTARLTLLLRDEAGQPLNGATVRLVPGQMTGTTDSQGRLELPGVVEGTYSIEARRAGDTATFHAVRVSAGKTAEMRLALTWRERDDRVARMRSRTPSRRG